MSPARNLSLAGYGAAPSRRKAHKSWAANAEARALACEDGNQLELELV